MKFNVLALTGFLALAVAQAPPAPPKAPGPPAPKPNADGPPAPKGPGGSGKGPGLPKCLTDCISPQFEALSKSGCQAPAFPKKDAGAGPGPSGAAPPPPSPGKGKVNIVARQAPPGGKGKGGIPGGGKGKGGMPGGGKGKGGPQLTDEQKAKFQEFAAKGKEYVTCVCKTQAPTDVFACATSKCTGDDAEAVSKMTGFANKICGKVDGFKPLAVPAPPGGPPAARMMTA